MLSLYNFPIYPLRRSCMYKLLIVDDFMLDRKKLSAILDRELFREIEIVGECENGEEALTFIALDKPDIIITDIEMPVMDGFELARNVLLSYPEIKIVFSSLYDEFEYAKKALYLNNYGYILKPIDEEELHSCLMHVIRDIESEYSNSRQRSYLEKVLESHIPKLSENLLLDLLKGNAVSREEVSRKLELYRIDLGRPYFRLILGEVDDPPYGAKGGDRNTQAAAMAEIIGEAAVLPGDGTKALAVNYGSGRFVVILNGKSADDTNRRTDKFGEDISRGCSDAGISLSLAVSSLGRDIMELATLLQGCSEAISLKYSLGKGSIIKCESLPDLSMEIDIDKEQLLPIVQRLIYTRDREICEVLDSLLNRYRKKASPESLKGFCFDLVSVIRESLHDGANGVEHLIPQDLLIYDTLASFDCLSDAGNWLKELLQNVRTSISSRNESRHGELIRTIKTYVKEHYTLNIGLDDIAGETGYSPNYINLIFKQHSQLTIPEYISNLRIERAKELLGDPELKIYSISQMLGFSNSAYFCRVFKKKLGLTPQVYRENHRI